jgi:glycerophosphoryl diester phosphodiesterase
VADPPRRAARYLTSSAVSAVGATAVGPSLATLKEYPQLVDRAVAQGRAVYCWCVDELEDIDFCRDVGVAWIATNHPGRTKAWLQDARTGEGTF